MFFLQLIKLNESNTLEISFDSTLHTIIQKYNEENLFKYKKYQYLHAKSIHRVNLDGHF